MLAETLGPSGDVPGDPERRLLYRLVAGALATAFTMTLSLAVASGYGFGALRALSPATADFAHVALLVAALPALVLLGPPVLRGGLRDARYGRPSLDVLFSLGVAAGTVASAYSIARGAGPVYLETVTMLLTLYTLGRYLEARAKGRAARVLSALLSVDAVTYERLSPDPGTVGAADLRTGDLVRVRAGEPLPADGTVEAGRAFVDASALTGEAVAQAQGPGDTVWAGTVALDGALDLRVTAAGAARRLAQIEAAVARALAQPPALATAADRALRLLVPLAFALALVTFGGWLLAGAGFDRALYAALAVVLIACPCALGLAVPLALTSALGAAAREGVLVRSGDALLRLAEVKAVVLDKTGTLTRPEGVRVRLLAPGSLSGDGAPREVGGAHLLALAAGLEAHVRHPLADAVLQEADRQGLAVPEAEDVVVESGLGLRGHVRDAAGVRRSVTLGSAQLMARLGLPVPSAEQGDDEAAWVAVDGVVEGRLDAAERPTAEARGAAQALRALGLHVEVLSGDRPGRALAVAEALGLPGSGGASPEQKRARVHMLREALGPVAVVGDGTNDALALAVADVGVAMQAGTAPALAAGDIVLYDDDLRRLPATVTLARRTRRVVHQNLAWTFAYNGAGLVVAAAGLLHPIVAVGIMTVSSLLVTWNALRLRGAPGASRLQA
ncbi:MAG: heavy metal translocating P-type ATPase [Rubricoccaceae bacterium]